MLEYSEYKAIMDVVETSDVDNVYPDLMNKEHQVLDTVNNVVNYYRNTKQEEKQFLHKSLHEIYNLMFLEVPLIMSELLKAKSIDDVTHTLTKNDRLIYLGVMLVVLSIILFFINSS